MNTETFPIMWGNLSGKDIEFLLLTCWLQIEGFVSSILSQEDTAVAIFFLHDISELHILGSLNCFPARHNGVIEVPATKLIYGIFPLAL